MKIHDESLGHYVNWLAEGRHFAFAGYSDAEWHCVMGTRAGERTALGQVICPEHGKRLLDVLRRRAGDPRFLFAVPKCLWPGRDRDGFPWFAEGQIDWFLGRENIALEGYERDRPLDDAAREGRLKPLIDQLQNMEVCMIGPRHLRGCESILKYKHFVEIETPNLHMAKNGIEEAVNDAWAWAACGQQQKVVLVSAGVSAAVIINRLHEADPRNFYIDCGSIWDAFVRAGGQRQWRAELYADEVKWRQWVQRNLEGWK